MMGEIDSRAPQLVVAHKSKLVATWVNLGLSKKQATAVTEDSLQLARDLHNFNRQKENENKDSGIILVVDNER